MKVKLNTESSKIKLILRYTTLNNICINSIVHFPFLESIALSFSVNGFCMPMLATYLHALIFVLMPSSYTVLECVLVQQILHGLQLPLKKQMDYELGCNDLYLPLTCISMRSLYGSMLPRFFICLMSLGLTSLVNPCFRSSLVARPFLAALLKAYLVNAVKRRNNHTNILIFLKHWLLDFRRPCRFK